jgi:hypothetical protein
MNEPNDTLEQVNQHIKEVKHNLKLCSIGALGEHAAICEPKLKKILIYLENLKGQFESNNCGVNTDNT